MTRHTPHLVWHVVCAPWVVPARLCMTIGRAMDPVITGRAAIQRPSLKHSVRSRSHTAADLTSIMQTIGQGQPWNSDWRAICSGYYCAHCCRPFNRIFYCICVVTRIYPKDWLIYACICTGFKNKKIILLISKDVLVYNYVYRYKSNVHSNSDQVIKSDSMDIYDVIYFLNKCCSFLF